MVDAITKTHFEGKGVIPDIKVPANDALIYAQIDFLEEASQNSSDKELYEWYLLDLKSELKPILISQKKLSTYVGKYGNIELTVIDNFLYSSREGIKTELIPLTENTFKLKGRDDLRIKVITENGKAIAIERLLANGIVLRTNKE